MWLVWVGGAVDLEVPTGAKGPVWGLAPHPHPPPSTVLAGHFSRNSIDRIWHHKFNWLLIFQRRGYGSKSGKQTVFHEKNFWPSTFFSDGEIFPGAGWIEVEKFVLSKLYESFTKSCCTCPSTQQSAQRSDIVESRLLNRRAFVSAGVLNEKTNLWVQLAWDI